MGRITESFYKMLAEHIKVYLDNIEDISYVVEKVNNIEQKINVLENIRMQVGKLDDLHNRIDNLNDRCTDLIAEQWRTKDALENSLIEKINQNDLYYVSKNMKNLLENGRFAQATEYENVVEGHRLLQLIEVPTYIDNMHDLLEFRVRGNTAQDKAKMLKKYSFSA